MIKRSSWKFKLFLIIFATSMIPILIVSMIMYNKSKETMISQISKSIISSTNFAMDNVDFSLKAIDEISKSILKDDRVINTAKITRILSEKEKIIRYSEIRDLLNYTTLRIQNKYRLSGMNSYYIYLVNQNTLIDSKTTYYENFNETNVDFILNTNPKKNSSKWFASKSINFQSTNENLETNGLLSLSKCLIDKKGDINAIVSINVSEYFLNDYFSKSQISFDGDSIVIDENSAVVSYWDKSLICQKTNYNNIINRLIDQKLEKKGQFIYKNNVIIYSISDYTKWKYLTIIPLSKIMGNMSSFKFILAILLSSLTIIILAITFLLSYIFFKPINKLILAMKEIENRNFDVKIVDDRRDEFQKVYNVFNEMINELNILIKNLVTEKILNKEAEIKLLQAQINPHFLYNTLETINSMAKIRDAEEISFIVTALSKFFRISLSSGKEMVFLTEAVDLAIAYLKIQDIRYNGKFEYHIEIPNQLKLLVVPKFTIQPIVENSILHGFENMKGGANIIIKCEENGTDLLISISDNGRGITKENLYALQDSINNEILEVCENFALRNINKQLKLKYGNGYGLTIDSNYGIGTKVCIKLPKRDG